MCLLSGDYTIYYNENGDENEKSRSHRYNINRPSSRNGHRYSRYKNCLSNMMLIWVTQHLSII